MGVRCPSKPWEELGGFPRSNVIYLIVVDGHPQFSIDVVVFCEFGYNSFLFEPSGGKSHAPDSIFMVPMPNSRILASKPLASSCLGRPWIHMDASDLTPIENLIIPSLFRELGYNSFFRPPWG